MEPNNDLLEMMATHEEKISELYKTFAETLPEWKGFWMAIASEEQGHAAWLRGLKVKLVKEGGLLNRDHFNVSGIKTSMDYLQRTRDEVVKKGMTPLRAFLLSLDIEMSLLEREYFTVYKSDLLNIQEVFIRLQEHTAVHRRRMQEKINEERAKQSKT